MAKLTTAEWILLSEIFRGSEEQCHQLLKHDADFTFEKRSWDGYYAQGLIGKVQLGRFAEIKPALADWYESECRHKGIRILTPDSDEYPVCLYDYLNPPVVLYAVGNLSLLAEENALTVVGTRKASEYGRQTAFMMSREVAAKGITIISGCAVGIDAAAHAGALAAGGRTIAVLGCGMDVNYPRENYRLRKEIVAKGGLLITEYPPGTEPFASFFPHRNRLLAGLSRAVLVAEAPYRSGSLITAEYAVEQGKEVFCVPPYSIWDERCSGVARYLRDGATPVFSPADILLHYFTLEPSLLNSEKFLQAALGFSDSKPSAFPPKRRKETSKEKKRQEPDQEDPAEEEAQKEKPVHDGSRWVLPPQITDERFRQVFGVLDNEPLTIDEIIAQCAVSPSETLAILSELEVLGLVENHSGSRYSVRFEPKQ